MEPISLDTTQPITPEPISLDTGNGASVLTPAVASQRAAKAAYAFSNISNKTQDDYYQQLTNGLESDVRREASSSLDFIREQATQKIIAQTAAQNGPMTMADMQHIRNMVANWNPSDPNSVIEDQFSVKAVNSIYTMGGTADTTDNKPYSFIEDAMRNIPDLTTQTTDEASEYGSKIEWWRNQRANIQSDLDNQSYVGWGVDQLKTMLQPYNEIKLRGLVPIDIWGGLGTSTDEQGKALLRLPKAEMIAKGTAILEHLRKDNPTLAAKFADAVVGNSDILLDNIFTALAVPDLVTGTKLAGALAKKTFLYNATRIAAKDMVKGLDNVGKQPIKAVVADSAGDLPEAAIQKEVGAITTPASSEQAALKDAMDQLPTVMRTDVENITKSPGRFGQEIVNRLRESYETFQTSLFDTIQRISKVERISPVLATETGLRALQQEIKESYPGLSNAIQNISGIYKRDLTNTYHADLVVGNPNGGLFTRPEAAKAFADYMGLGIKDDAIVQQGLGYYIKVTKPVNETSKVVRDFLTSTAASRSPTSWVSAFAGMLRTPEETLAHEQLLNRKIATYAPSELMKVAKDTAKDIEKLGKWTLPFTARRARYNEWERAVNYAQEARDPITKERGYFFSSPQELQEFYQTNFNRLPQQQEVLAYFAFKRLGEMDHILRNLQIYKNMTRVGAENHIISVLNAEGQKVASKVFQGVIRKDFPGGDGTVLISDGKHGTERIYFNGSINTTRRRELTAGIKDGTYKVIELYDPELRPLAGFSPAVKDERIRYVIVKTGDVESKPLNYVNLPYKGGGHFEYDYEHYIKQANIRSEKGRAPNGKFSVKHWYEGDTTVIPIAIRAMGEDVAKKMNEVRLLILNKDIDGAKEAAKSLPMEWDTFYKWFKPTKNPVTGEIIPPRLNVREPFQVVQRGRSIIDTTKDALENRYGKSSFFDGTRKGSLARQYQVQYTGSRDAYDLFTLKNEGTSVNPLYKIADPKLMDPIPTMNRALSRITNSFFMDDYKISSIEHWLKEASPFLAEKESRIQYAPFHVFNNISENAWKKGAPPEMVRQLETRRQQILQFVGTPSQTEAMVHSLSQKLADSIYNKYGPEGLRIAGFQITPDNLLNKLKNPVQFVRSVTFHAKLGLFSVPQFLVQSQTYVNIAGVAGFSKAIPGTFATLLHQWSRINPTMIEAMDRYASRFHIPGTSRWRPGEFKEAWTELQNTGFANVAGEYALRDDLMSHKVFTSGKDKFLDAGTFFFKEGERNVRLGAWYTAYREWRDLHPTAKITDVERREILDRATLLNVNMDRSSNSVLQHGAFSIPAQFLTYQVRAAELFLGKRLTGLERARLFATNAAVYGVPTAISGAAIFPFGDNIRKAAIDNGYVMGDSYFTTLMEGLPAQALALATGNYYNIGERYGSQGFTPIRDALMSDRTIWDIMTGAAGSTLGNTWAASDGFRTAMLGFIRGDDKQFKLKANDVVDIFKEISSINGAWKLWAGLNTGRWMTKTEQWASDVSPLNAVFQTISGLQNQEISDVRTMRMIKKDEKALADYSINKFVQEAQRGFRSMKDDPEQGNAFLQRAFTWLKIGGVPEERWGEAMSRATDNYENLIDKGKWDFYLKNVPSTKPRFGLPGGVMDRQNVPQQRLDTLQRQLQMKGQ